jgi:hypothetical protein
MSERRMQTLREIATACDLGPISTVWASYLNESLDAYRDEKARADAAEARIASLVEAITLARRALLTGNGKTCTRCLATWTGEDGWTEDGSHHSFCPVETLRRALNPGGDHA